MQNLEDCGGLVHPPPPSLQKRRGAARFDILRVLGDVVEKVFENVLRIGSPFLLKIGECSDATSSSKKPLVAPGIAAFGEFGHGPSASSAATRPSARKCALRLIWKETQPRIFTVPYVQGPHSLCPRTSATLDLQGLVFDSQRVDESAPLLTLPPVGLIPEGIAFCLYPLARLRWTRWTWPTKMPNKPMSVITNLIKSSTSEPVKTP